VTAHQSQVKGASLQNIITAQYITLLLTSFKISRHTQKSFRKTNKKQKTGKVSDDSLKD